MTGTPPDADPDDVFGRPPAGWAELARVADDLWAGSDLADEYPRPIDRIAVMRLPLFLVDLPSLSLARVRRWLDEHRLPGGPSARPIDRKPRRPADEIDTGANRGDGCAGDGGDDLMGCLYAHGGHGYAFVCATDLPGERRLTIAHEVAHFLLDYLRPRRRVLDALGPAAVDVLDGRRPATVAERAAAVLAHVRVGPHLHLLARDAGGSADSDCRGDGATADAALYDPAVAAAERRADALAVELVAPRARVAERLWIAGAGRGDHGRPRRMRIGPAADADDDEFVAGDRPDATEVAAELARYFGLPPYALARYLRPRPAPQRSPLLDAARLAVNRARWRRETDP